MCALCLYMKVCWDQHRILDRWWFFSFIMIINNCHFVFQKYLNQIAYLEQALKEKNKENKRLKENFETMKQANDALKKEVRWHSPQLMRKSSRNLKVICASVCLLFLHENVYVCMCTAQLGMQLYDLSMQICIELALHCSSCEIQADVSHLGDFRCQCGLLTIMCRLIYLLELQDEV